MNKEEQEAIKELKHYINITPYWKKEEFTSSEVDIYIKIVLNYIDKQEKIIDSLAQWVSNLSPMVDKQAVKDIIYKENKDE